MIIREYLKLCNVSILAGELMGAGFLVRQVAQSLRQDGNYTVLYLDDAETKDPAAIVNAHIYKKPKTVEELQAEQIEALKTMTLEQKVDFLLELRGLKERSVL